MIERFEFKKENRPEEFALLKYVDIIAKRYTRHISDCYGEDIKVTEGKAYSTSDTMGRMHSDAQFAGSSSVSAHVEMMGFLGIGNNPMVGCTVACAVDVAQALNK